MSLPVISRILKSHGYISAKAGPIRETLGKKGRSVGVILDGIAGMFPSGLGEEVYVKNRKAIVAIALEMGVEIVPVYAFGHTSLWSAATDPFGILKAVSIRTNVSLLPFFGRWGWPMGPPRRQPLLLAFGNPVRVPDNPEREKPSRKIVDLYHQRMVTSLQDAFEHHKTAYGWPEKQLTVI